MRNWSCTAPGVIAVTPATAATPAPGFATGVETATVTVPLLRAPILGALLLVFVFALGSYLLPQVLGRPEHWTLSVHITDQAIFQSNLPFAAAMAVLLLLATLVLVGLALLLGRERETAP